MHRSAARGIRQNKIFRGCMPPDPPPPSQTARLQRSCWSPSTFRVEVNASAIYVEEQIWFSSNASICFTVFDSILVRSLTHQLFQVNLIHFKSIKFVWSLRSFNFWGTFHSADAHWNVMLRALAMIPVPVIIQGHISWPVILLFIIYQCWIPSLAPQPHVLKCEIWLVQCKNSSPEIPIIIDIEIYAFI